MPNDRPAKKARAATKKTTHEGRVTESERVDPRNPNNLTITSADQWGQSTAPAEEGFITPLPSGNVVRMQRTMDLPIMLASGQIPNPLATIVSEMMETGSQTFPQESAKDMRVMKQLMNLLNRVFCNAVLEPRFEMPEVQGEEESEEDYFSRINAWKPKPGNVNIFDVVLQDKMFVYAVAQGAAADLARFRSQSESDVFSLPAGSNLGE
jgi:hypothetical protein